MGLEISYLYSESDKYGSSTEGIVEKFKKALNIKDSSKYHDNEVTIFYDRLLTFSKQLGLGENISIDTIYDGKIPEKVFTIYCDVNLNKSQKYDISELVHKYMKSFSESEGLQDFFKDAYILIK